MICSCCFLECAGSSDSSLRHNVVTREYAGQESFNKCRRDLLNCRYSFVYLIGTTSTATDIGVAVPAPRAKGTFRDRVSRSEPREQGIVDAAVQVNEAGDRKLLLAGEAARGLAGDAAGSVVAAVRIAALAPDVIGEPLHHHAVLV